MRESSILLINILLLAACTSGRESTIDKYFDVPGFINEQMDMLNSRDAQISKTVRFGDKAESLTLSDLDLEQWQKELRIFEEHDINKPVLVDAYTIDQVTDDQGNKTTTYNLTDNSELGILKMEIKQDGEDQVSAWSSSFQEENLLYCNFRELTLTTGDQGILNSYRINGYHKLMFNDTVYYQIEVDITF
jgi:hypothetical protein